MTESITTHEEHHVPYSTYVYVWAILIFLTGVTVAAAVVDLRHLAVIIATYAIFLILTFADYSFR